MSQETIDRTLGRLEEKVDNLSLLLAEKVGQHHALEFRVSALERWKMWIAGATSLALGVATATGAVLLLFLEQLMTQWRT